MTAALYVAAAIVAGAICLLIGFWCGYMARLEEFRWGVK